MVVVLVTHIYQWPRNKWLPEKKPHKQQLSSLESRYFCFYREHVSDNKENILAGHWRDLVSCKLGHYCERVQLQTTASDMKFYGQLTGKSLLPQSSSCSDCLSDNRNHDVGRESTNQLGMLTHILSARYLWWEKTVFCSERVWNLGGTGVSVRFHTLQLTQVQVCHLWSCDTTTKRTELLVQLPGRDDERQRSLFTLS